MIKEGIQEEIQNNTHAKGEVVTADVVTDTPCRVTNTVNHTANKVVSPVKSPSDTTIYAPDCGKLQMSNSLID